MQKFLTMFDSLDSWPTIAIIHRNSSSYFGRIFYLSGDELDIQLQNELDRNFAKCQCSLKLFTCSRNNFSLLLLLEINLAVYINEHFNTGLSEIYTLSLRVIATYISDSGR